jgi:hypothetical protein
VLCHVGDDDNDECIGNQSDESGDEWFIEQTLDEQDDSKLILSSVKYGFASQKSNVFAKLGVSDCFCAYDFKEFISL